MQNLKEAATKNEQSSADKTNNNVLKFPGKGGAKTMLKIAGGSALAVVGLAVVMPFMGAIMLFSLSIGAIAFMATMGYAVYFIRNRLPFSIADWFQKIISNPSDKQSK